MRRYLKYIIFNAIAIIATGVIIYFGRQHAFSWVLLPEVVWIACVAGVNLFFIFREPRDFKYELAKACRDSAFKEQLNAIADAYDEVLCKEEFFSAEEFQGSVFEAYSLIRQQIESNTISALDIDALHPKGKPANSGYMDELKAYSEELVGKLGELVEQAIRLQSIKDDVDTSFVDDYIQALNHVLESNNLTLDAYAAKYGEGADDDD